MGRGDGGASRIRGELVKSLIEQHGESAYTVAIENINKYDDGFIQDMWRKILSELDEHFKGEEQ